MSRTEGHEDESRRRHDLTDLARIHGETVEPLQIRPLHPARRAPGMAGEDIQGAPNPDENRDVQLLAMPVDPLFLLRNPQSNAEHVRLRIPNLIRDSRLVVRG